VHFAFLNKISLDGITILSAQEVTNKVSILFIINTQLLSSIVFELWVILHLSWNFFSSEDPHSLDFKLWLFSKDGVHGPSVLSKVVNSLQETIHKVKGLVENNSLTFVHLVVEFPYGETFLIVLLEEGLHGFISLVWVVNEESLEVVHVE
jgi:hypothetical protein